MATLFTPNVPVEFIKSEVGQTCRPHGTHSGGYCSLPSNVKHPTPQECLARCEAWEDCICGVSTGWLYNGIEVNYCQLFVGDNAAPTTEDCQLVMDRNEAFAGLYQPFGRLTCGDEYPFGAADASAPLTLSIRRDDWSYSEDCVDPEPVVPDNFQRSKIGQTCRPRGTHNGGYCSLPSYVKHPSPQECLALCEAWEDCKCGIAAGWYYKGNPVNYCHLFWGENTNPTNEFCQQVMGRDEAFGGLYQPWGGLTCHDDYPWGAADDAHPLTLSTRRTDWSYDDDCFNPLTPLPDAPSVPKDFTRSGLGETCRPRGTHNGGYCTLPSNVKHPSPQECMALCEAWEDCKCGAAAGWYYNGNPVNYCHLFIGENFNPSTETCQDVMGRDEAVSGLYQPFGALTCRDDYPFGKTDPAQGLTISTRRNNWFYSNDCFDSNEPTPGNPIF